MVTTAVLNFRWLLKLERGYLTSAASAIYDNRARLNGSLTESRGRLRTVKIEKEIAMSVEGELNKADTELEIEVG